MALTQAEISKRWREKPANRIKERLRNSAAYHADINKGRAQKRIRQARYRARHPEKVRAIARANYLKNRDKRLKNALAYQAANLATTVRANRHNRRARQRSAEGRITKAIAAELRLRQGDRCAYCPTTLNGAGHLDHKTPLSRGGTNLSDNLQWLCAPCNLHKYTMTDAEFREAA